jgi:hypothetical protein
MFFKVLICSPGNSQASLPRFCNILKASGFGSTWYRFIKILEYLYNKALINTTNFYDFEISKCFITSGLIP